MPRKGVVSGVINEVGLMLHKMVTSMTPQDNMVMFRANAGGDWPHSSEHAASQRMLD